jgi:hypothetical protein
MRFALQKNRTAPLIVFAIIGILFILSLASFYMNRMSQCSYDRQYEEYDARSEHAATLISQELNDSLRTLRTGAIYIAKAGIDNDLITKELLSELCESNSYISMVAIESNGMGFNQAGQTKNYSEEDYFKASIQKNNYISHRLQFDEKDNPYLILAVPIVKNGVCEGVLAAWRKGEISNIALLDQEIKDGASIYLVNSNNELVSYITGSDIKNFNYDRLIPEEELNVETGRIKNRVIKYNRL